MKLAKKKKTTKKRTPPARPGPRRTLRKRKEVDYAHDSPLSPMYFLDSVFSAEKTPAAPKVLALKQATPSTAELEANLRLKQQRKRRSKRVSLNDSFDSSVRNVSNMSSGYVPPPVEPYPKLRMPLTPEHSTMEFHGSNKNTTRSTWE